MFGTPPEDKMDRDLLSFCIEIVLLRMGVPEYEKVVSRLEKDYSCAISDCDRNPEFLKGVLQDTFGEAHTVIISEIRKQLGEASSKKYFADFISAMKND
jgi:hypothetical protein